MHIKNYPTPLLGIICFISMTACDTPRYWTETQLTFSDQNHELDYNENFSPDDQWIVYDTRPNPAGIALNTKIEKVHVSSRIQEILYQVSNPTPFGPGVGAVSYHPFLPQVVFIHGLQPANEKQPYAAHRRSGVILDERDPETLHYMDSRDIYDPFTPGALRGGTHRHQWSGDGDWMGYTYNDALMVDLESKTGQKNDLRTIGVSKRIGPKVPVKPDSSNIQGEWFSALVVPVVPNPKPGTDEISRAYEDWWVGSQGYRKPDDTYQRARGFIGDLITDDGANISEVFVVDIPDDIHIPGNEGPLEGTAETMPAPPKGVTIRRITRTENRTYPGVSPNPRHWVSSPADGSYISYLAKDDTGIVQVFLVSPLGGEPIQATHHETDVQSMVRWHPTSITFAYVTDNSLFTAEVSSEGKVSNPTRITEKKEEAPFAHCWSRNGAQIAFNRYVTNGNDRFIQIFIAKP
ncbi:DUF3748 domain-containing protein [Lunatibacter salilacus]|uniref:DUF3748 domain-containing protein n=1 Tax=Lunatibacter salilacus TaxID=2483804 RepID=UPI001F4264A4|nr:DUF3748 domain-containing protein [Lunatibacter salilacus]